MITVLEPGTYTTIQDIGRTGYQDIGVPVCGAVDKFSLRAANLLLGNDENAPALEVTIFGPKLKFNKDTLIAITGGDLTPSIDDVSVDNWTPILVSKGSILSFSGPSSGLRSYIAFAGGISEESIDYVMGSYSTYVSGGFGGVSGRKLIEGDILQVNYQAVTDYESVTSITFDNPPTFDSECVLRILLGPQDKSFSEDSINVLTQNEYILSLDSDSVGIKLDGELLVHKGAPDVISEGTAFGAIQVPGDGLPIILMSNRGTAGGYPKIATVINADHSKLAQLMPGNKIRFSLVTYEEAVEEFRVQEKSLDSLRGTQLKGLPTKITASDLLVSVTDENGKELLNTLNPQVSIAEVRFGERVEEIRIEISD